MRKRRRRELERRAKREAGRYMVTRDDESFATVESFTASPEEQKVFMDAYHAELNRLDSELC